MTAAVRRAVCPGSFDPVTHGHCDIIARAARLFDEVIVGIGINTSKNAMFSSEERVEMLTAAVADLPNVSVEPLTGLLVEFCRCHDAQAVVKGLRFASDFDYELQMAQMNKQLSGIETILLPTAAQWSFVSSTMIREIAKLGGNISDFVPDVVTDHLRRRQGEIQ